MKRSLMLVALAFAIQGAQAADWSGWWRTPDQQGDALLKAGKPQDAARTYADPQRKAYAELQGGNYAQAARDYAASNSADAHYNRGNALAHSGDLAGALKAYDAALAQAPQHRDALHNRDLVQKALQQKQPPKQDQNKQDQKQDPKKQDQKQDQQKKDQQQDQKSGQKDEQKPGDPKDQQKPGESKDQQKPGESKEQPKPGAQKDQPKPGQQPTPDQAKDGKPPADDKKQAAQDAAASLGKDGAAKPSGAKPGVQEPIDPRAEEKRVSEAQWLRAIPDDPGGLLRRKLMIEHMIRQQEGQK